MSEPACGRKTRHRSRLIHLILPMGVHHRDPIRPQPRHDSRVTDTDGDGCIDPGIFLSNFQGGGAFEILDLLLKQISDLLKKLWTFQYAAGFRGPGISQNIQQIF